VWIITWVPTSEEPSTGPDDRVGATRDTEAHDVFIGDGVSAGGNVGRKPGNVPVLRPRQSTVSLVGLSPAQVQYVLFSKESMALICFYSAFYWYTRRLGLRFSSDMNMEWPGKRNLVGAGEALMEA
jgi:hypothetical protein